MQTIELNLQEQKMLVEVLERCLVGLDHEISHADRGEFKQMLRRRQVVIADILHKIPALLEHVGIA